MQLVKYLVEQ